MAFFPLSIFFEFVVLIGVGLILLQMDGVMPKVIAMFLFLSGIGIAIGNQYWMIENPPGTLTEVTFKPYPTGYVVVLIWLHILLGYFAVAKIFRDLGRDWRGSRYPEIIK